MLQTMQFTRLIATTEGTVNLGKTVILVNYRRSGKLRLSRILVIRNW